VESALSLASFPAAVCCLKVGRTRLVPRRNYALEQAGFKMETEELGNKGRLHACSRSEQVIRY